MDIRRFDVFVKQCRSRKAFDNVFSRWGLLVLAKLHEEPLRFRQLVRSLNGITDTMLTKTLRILEEEGFVERNEEEGTAQKVEYSLTKAGEILSEGVLFCIDKLYDSLVEREESSF